MQALRAWFSLVLSSDHLGSPQVVQVEYPQQAARIVHYGQGSDLFLLHDVERSDRVCVRVDRLRMPCHAALGGKLENFFTVTLHQPSQITVTDNAHQLA